ncbi:MAG: ArsA family ATPase [Labilithrix sp.]|nr:ArsA family ATPase [Labilithrix sp.]MCW5835165.1 ArsA family ATPase [Labilithrix sp.]
MKRLLPLRAVLVTGKGGVGKTTVAASLARFAAQSGKRVLVTEIAGEGATSSALADALGIAGVQEEPHEIAPNLRVAALAPALGHQRFLRDVLPMKLLADAAMRAGAIRRFLSAAPTFPEMGVLYRLLDLVRAKRKDGADEHEMIIVDLPATGHALALAQIPASLLRVIPTGPIAAAVREGLELLRDPARTGAVVVTLPETLPVSEAIELVQGIEEHRIPLAQLFVNRVPFDPFSDEEREFVRSVLDARPPTLGERTLERIDRARVALGRVAEAVSAPIGVLQDVWLDGPRLAEEMASLMAVEEGA